MPKHIVLLLIPKSLPSGEGLTIALSGLQQTQTKKKALPGTTGKPYLCIYIHEIPTGPGGSGGDGGMRSFWSSVTKVLNIFKNANTLRKKFVAQLLSKRCLGKNIKRHTL